MRFLAALRSKQKLEGKTNKISPNNHLTTEGPFHGFPDQRWQILLRFWCLCHHFVKPWQCSSCRGFTRQTELRKGKRERKKNVDFLSSFFGKPFSHQKDVQIALWETHMVENWVSQTGNKISCQQLWEWIWEQVLQHQSGYL